MNGYTVELGGQVFTRAQWEALQPYIEARASADSEDAATWVAPAAAPAVPDSEIAARLAEMLVRCGIERGQLGRIDADNLARCLLPVVREIADREGQR